MNLFKDETDAAEKIRKDALQKSQFDKKQFCTKLIECLRKFKNDIEREKKTYHYFDNEITDTYMINIINELIDGILPEIEKLAKEEEFEKKVETGKIRYWDLQWQKVNIYCNKFWLIPDYGARDKDMA
ncbi:MAG: hypothetical protein QMC83_07845 [Thermodesulfovibrionales bacterium]|nr:hypothetical protein [Thermodesulfovibrionales bacterium]